MNDAGRIGVAVANLSDVASANHPTGTEQEGLPQQLEGLQKLMCDACRHMSKHQWILADRMMGFAQERLAAILWDAKNADRS